MSVLRWVLVGCVCAVILWVGGVAAWRHFTNPHDPDAYREHLRLGEPYRARVIERLADIPGVLAETSGVAVSRSHSGVFWSHNDAGGSARIFAVGLDDGMVRAVFRLEDVLAEDWEDMATAPCPEEARTRRAWCIWIGDIGDNEREREFYRIHVVPEPDPVRGEPSDEVPISARTLVYRYRDDSYDGESLAVGPDGDVLLVNKGRAGVIRAFTLPAGDVHRALVTGDTLTAREGPVFPIEPRSTVGRMATGAAFSPSGELLALRTYTEIYFFRPGENGSLEPLGERCFLGDLEPQGEGVDFLDEETLIITSESRAGRNGSVHRVVCR